MSLITDWIPVNPQLNDSGEFVSLKNFGNGVKPNPLDASGPLDFFSKEYKYSLSESSKIEISAIGGIENKFGTTTFIHDSLIYKTSLLPIPGGNDFIKGTRWGCGMRLKVKVTDSQFGVKANWGIVAAALQLGYVDAEFEIEILGTSKVDLFSLLPSPTDLNLKTFNEILDIGDKIRRSITTPSGAGIVYKPLRIYVDISRGSDIDPINDDRHLIFVYQQVKERVKLKTAVSEGIQKNLDPVLIRKFYKDFFSLINDNDRPSGDQRYDAEKWLDR